MSADKPKNFDESEKELELYGSWVKGSSDEIGINTIDDDYDIIDDQDNALMTDEEEMLLSELENSESDSETSFGDISFDEFEDLEDEINDTFGMEHPDDSDTDNEVKALIEFCNSLGVKASLCTHWANGGEGTKELAAHVSDLCEKDEAKFQFLYESKPPLFKKIEINLLFSLHAVKLGRTLIRF